MPVYVRCSALSFLIGGPSLPIEFGSGAAACVGGIDGGGGIPVPELF